MPENENDLMPEVETPMEDNWYYSIRKEFYSDDGLIYEMYTVDARHSQGATAVISTWSTYEEAYDVIVKLEAGKKGTN